MKDFKFLGISSDKIYGDLNDIQYTSTGEIQTVAGKDRRFQDIARILMTSLDQFPIPEYGTDLHLLLNNDLLDPVISQEVQSTIVSAVAFLALLESGNSKEEAIKAVEALDITPNVEGRTLEVDLIVSLESGDVLSFKLGG